MKRFPTFTYFYAWSELQRKLATRNGSSGIDGYLQTHRLIKNRFALSAIEANRCIHDALLQKQPFMAGRLGGHETACFRAFDFETKSKYAIALHYLSVNAGFFPATREAGKHFSELMVSSIPYADFVGLFMWQFEIYYYQKYGNQILQHTYVNSLEPWYAPRNPWTAALKGKKVLVIHPFARSIEKQYAQREKLFPGTDILPEFELKTLKAVQTSAGETDGRFTTWFDALDWMEKEALEIDFDVSIIGCGAYGFPLAAKLKAAGKQVIHLGGPTQLLFGIWGNRWNLKGFETIQQFRNKAWVHPDESERPANAKQVESGCYW